MEDPLLEVVGYEANAGPVVLRLIEHLLAANNIAVHSVSYRVKSGVSVERKLGRYSQRRTLRSLTDLLGVRIVTYMKSEVDSSLSSP